MAGHFKNLHIHLTWNYVSFALLAIAGLTVSIVIGRVYGAEGLGIFNLIYAFYIIGCQFTTMGLHYSTLKHVAEEHDHTQQGIIAFNAAMIGLVSSTIIGLLLYLTRGVFSNFMNAPEIADGITYIIPGLIFITLNKVMLWFYNGQKRMVLYAITNMIRSTGIIMFLVLLVFKQKPAYMMGLIFTLADGVLLLVFIGLFIKEYRQSLKYSKNWIVKHLTFSSKATLGAIIVDTNARVDVLMLGFFTNPKIVGLYSFAAILIEGVLQLMFVLRTMINPVLVKSFRDNNIAYIQKILNKTMLYLYPLMAIGIFIAAVLFHPVISLLGLEHFSESYAPLMVLLVGVAILAPFYSFNEIFMQAGLSGRYSQLMVFATLTNFILNFILIQKFGMIGSAYATAIAFVMNVVYLELMCRRYLKFSLIRKNYS